MDDDTIRKSKDDEIKALLGSNPIDTAMGLLQMSEKSQKGKKECTKRTGHQSNAENSLKRRNVSKGYLEKVFHDYGEYLILIIYHSI